jgi:hypothetical protein
MLRGANALDFWRGFALITIFINHIPGVVFERLTHKNLSFSDSAELFVFLAGWSCRKMIGNPKERAAFIDILVRMLGRAVTLYGAHMMIVMFAIAMLASASRYLDNPLLLEWHNAAAVFQDPINTHIGLVLLSHQLGYFDILPLYVVLMVVAPIIALVHRHAQSWLLPVSISIYLVALIFQITVPTWPTEGQWFFNPLCWQLVFVLGFTVAFDEGPGAWVRANMSWLRPASWAIVVAAAIAVWFRWWPDPTRVPEPKLLFIAVKAYVTPIRLIQFLALVMVFSALYPVIEKHLPKLVAWLSMLGRNSLQVFCVGSVLSLAAQILRFTLRGGVLIDTLVVVGGIIMLSGVAWLTEWRKRSVRPV